MSKVKWTLVRRKNIPQRIEKIPHAENGHTYPQVKSRNVWSWLIFLDSEARLNIPFVYFICHMYIPLYPEYYQKVIR